MERTARRITIGFLGAMVTLIGILAIPLPGPGWAIIFLGIGIWAKEFEFARRLLNFMKANLRSWKNWAQRQSPLVRILIWTLTAVFILVILWLLNGPGMINHLFDLGLDWMDSPLPFYH